MGGNPPKLICSDVRHFGWEPCGLSIFEKDGSKILQCHPDTDNVFNLSVTLSRALVWDERTTSWRWYKTWKLPECVVTTGKAALHGIGNLEAQLAVVCRTDHPPHLENAGIQTKEGICSQVSLQLVEGSCSFHRLRLVATTSTAGGRLFHFIVSVVQREGDCVWALASVISTAFAVYSRKDADKKRRATDSDVTTAGGSSEGYFFAPFEPKELDRVFFKKATNSDGILVKEEITNSWDGLLAYFQAPNIRFKIRHPLFLAIRFSNVLAVLRDSHRYPQESEDAWRSFIGSCGFPRKCKRDPAVNIGQGELLPPWLIAFRSSAMIGSNSATIQKVAEFMQIVKGPALGFVPDDSFLPHRYSTSFDIDSLAHLYAKMYAIEFAGGAEENGRALGIASKLGKSEVVRKRTEAEKIPTGVEGFLGNDSRRSPICDPERIMVPLASSDKVDNMERVQLSDVTSRHKSLPIRSNLLRSSFESYFIGLHGEVRMLLNKVDQLVSQCVASQQGCDVENLRRAYKDFTAALAVLTFVVEHILFKQLSDRAPKLSESYFVDHVMERAKIEEINNIMSHLEPQKIPDLFLKISEFKVLHNSHSDKKEYHLLPYFLENFDDREISNLIRRCQSAFNDLAKNASKIFG